MKRIVCELCEGTEFTKENGMFVCHGCGTKYTAEEAKNMMREVEGAAPVVTGASVVGVPVVNPNQQQLENILILASTAYEASNLQEAENYCNKAIELDATSYKAWFLKGKAVGWSSTIGKLRIEEAAHSFCKAIDFAPEDEREGLKEQAVEEIQKLGLALVGTRKNRFIESPQSEADGFKSDMKTIFEALLVLLQHGNAVEMPQEYLHQICTLMYEAGDEAFEKADKAYLAKKNPEINDFSEYGANLLASVIVIKNSIEINNDEKDEVKLERYKKISEIAQRPISTTPKVRAVYKKEWNSILSTYLPTVDQATTLSAIAILVKGISDQFSDKPLKDIIDSLEKKVKENKEEEKRKAEEEKQARIAAYWEAHADEKAALDSEKAELNAKVGTLPSQINEIEAQIKAARPTGDVPSEEETKKIKDQIRDLENRRAKLGMFSGKEKKQIGEEIASLSGRVDSLKAKIEEEKKARQAEADKKIAPLQTKVNELRGELDKARKRISAIDAELTKDPEA